MTDSDVSVYSSWRGLVSALASPALVLSLGVLGLAASGLRPLPAALTALGLLLAAIGTLDYPRHTVFDATGITRVCVFRRHHLPWATVRGVQRTRGSFLSYARLRSDGDVPLRARTPSGGLVARGPGGRRYLLADRIESQPEYDRIVGVLERHAAHVAVTAARPAASTPPTTLYRRGVPNPLHGRDR